MAKFEFHGKPETIEELRNALPRDGTPWGPLLVEAVKAHKGVHPLPEKHRLKRSLERETVEMLPDDEVERFKYLKESIELRKKMEARELVLAPPEAVDYDRTD